MRSAQLVALASCLLLAPVLNVWCNDAVVAVPVAGSFPDSVETCYNLLNLSPDDVSEVGHSYCASFTKDAAILTSLLRFASNLTADPSTKVYQLSLNDAFTDSVPDATGVLATNSKLDDGSKHIFEFLNGPESFAFQGDFVYAATNDGIYKIDLSSEKYQKLYDGSANCSSPSGCSRPLGIRVNGDTLLCADAKMGILRINTHTGDTEVLLRVGTEIEGEKITFPDDLDVDWDRGLVYFSDASTKWPFSYWLWSVLENDPSGRIIRYNLKSGEAEIFAKGIQFANGVQLSQDGKSLLVSDFGRRRILQFAVGEALPVTGIPFTKAPLPGNPDNIRPSRSGGYWVAFATARLNGSRTLGDELQARPIAAKKLGDALLSVGELLEMVGKYTADENVSALGIKMSTGRIILDTYPNVGAVVELDEQGNVLQMLQSHQDRFLTEAHETDDGLYLGSFINSFLLRVPGASYRTP